MGGNDAKQEADLRRNDAEGQIEFMLTDLKDKLEGVERLDALQLVGDKAASYYNQYSISDHDDDALERRARGYHYPGEIKETLGGLETTREILLESIPNAVGLGMRNPENTEWLSTLTILKLILAETSLTQELHSNAKADFSKLAEYANRLDELSDGTAKYFISYSSRARQGRVILKNKLN